jgi:hypothetical protein
MADKTCMCGVNYEDSGAGMACAGGIDVTELEVALDGGGKAKLTFTGGILTEAEIEEE